MKQVILFIAVAALFVAAILLFRPYSGAPSEQDFTQYVDPYTGSGGHGHVFVGANVPFGLVQVGPSNIPQSWDWCSGYHISDSTIIGFSHMHLSGTGIGDLGDINLMPAVGEVTLNRGTSDDYSTGLYSRFRRETETVKAGYYAVHLDRYNIDVELTATKRTGFHRYAFPPSDDAKVVIDLENGQCWDKPVRGYIVQENDTVVSGFRYSTGWASDQRIYFTAVFSRPIKRFMATTTKAITGGEAAAAEGERVYGVAQFNMAGGGRLDVKVALSPVSIANAKRNMQAELPGWDFNHTATLADRAWNDELSKIAIETSDESLRRTFYTALYHTMIAPSVFCDVNGDYRGADGEMHASEGFTNYTTFSLWDTYRAAHPLMTIIHAEKMNDIIRTMLTIYEQQGKLPVWHLMGCETDCMVGNPGIPVVADAILKGFDGFDRTLAFDAMRASAMLDERGLKYLKQYGYIPYDKEEEGLAKCMEYAIADWSIAQVALALDKPEDHRYFSARSKAYRHYFDSGTGFVRGRSSSGTFRPTFNPFESVHRDNDYTEGNAWQYTWLVPHDIEGLVGLFGSTERFVGKLDSLFVAEGSLGEHASPDISGLIGQYAHGNEPSHHIIYMYPYVGQPWKTAEKVREVLSVMYGNAPEGLSGNEDVGQMSAWYVLSAMGFYQVEPAGGKYVFGSPVVDRAVIRVADGKTFTVEAVNNSADNKYIRRVMLNGQPYDRFWIDYRDIAAGGTLTFEMSPTPPDIAP
ncbi:MAG: GH92 family glycosyl hydrolase [Prevotellaceae bacterium]|jgi:predicted alpha-1,2-mannosidase|nr:GH92 family glycosyl hydrolase [Prevotellaceae bacterium]